MEQEVVGGVADPRMLVLTRESRGLTQGQLADLMQTLEGLGGKTSQGFVSRAEAGRLTVTGDRLELYARALGYPVALLCLTELEVGAGAGLVHHRKKQAAKAGDLKRIHAVLNLVRIQLRGLLSDVPPPTAVGIPRIPVDDLTTPADAARQLRRAWGLATGPLDSTVAPVEQAGVLLASRELVAAVPLDSGTESVPIDAVSCSPPGERPLVLLNAGTPAVRQRYTLAHEVGHMVMHQVPHPEQERQANTFAAELLMPARDIRPQLEDGPVTLRRLLELKTVWKVSMWALMRRAHTLGVISDWQYRTLAVEMSSLGYRFQEPGELDGEQPTAVRSAIAWQLRRGRTVAELARTALLTATEFGELYLGDGRCPETTAPPATGRRAAEPDTTACAPTVSSPTLSPPTVSPLTVSSPTVVSTTACSATSSRAVLPSAAAAADPVTTMYEAIR